MRSVMLLLASDLVMVRCIMLCIVMLIFAFNDITEGTKDVDFFR